MVCTPLGRFPNYCPRCRSCCIRCMQHPKLNSKLRKWVSGPWCRKPKRLAYCCQPLRLCWQRRHHTSDFSILLFLSSGAELKTCVRETSRAKKGLKAELRLRGCSGLFPVSEGHKLIQNFLQSLEPPFLVGSGSCISPMDMRAVCFTNLGYFLPEF